MEKQGLTVREMFKDEIIIIENYNSAKCFCLQNQKLSKQRNSLLALEECAMDHVYIITGLLLPL